MTNIKILKFCLHCIKLDLLSSFLTLWLVFPFILAKGKEMKSTITLNKITVFSEFEHCWKNFGKNKHIT